MTGFKRTIKEHTFEKRGKIMWFRQEKNGNYRYFERYKNPYTEKYKVLSISLSSKSRQAQKEAQLILNRKIQAKLAEAPTEELVKGVTFDKLAYEWLEIYKKQVRNSTFDSTKSIVKKLLEVLPPDVLVSNMTPALISNTLERLLYDDKHNLSNKYVQIVKSKLGSMLHYATTKNYILSNPVNEAKISWKQKTTAPKIKDKFLEKDELKALLDYSYKKNLRYALLIEWLYLTGMRIGEALALDWSDIIVLNDKYIVSVTGTLEYKNIAISEQYKSDQTKTAAGMREITLPSVGVTIYEKLKALNYDNGNFIFQTSTGSVIQPSSFNRFLRKAKDDLGIDKPVSSHIFRHTHISKLAELGVPLYVIQNRVGHDSSDITKKIYLHVTDKAKEKLDSKLDQL